MPRPGVAPFDIEASHAALPTEPERQEEPLDSTPDCDDVVSGEGWPNDGVTKSDPSDPGPKQADALFRRVSRRVVIPCCLVAFVCYVDRTNLGLGADDFCRHLGITNSQYGTGVSLFFVGYSVFQIPSNLILERVGTPLWMCTIMITWGMAASAMAFVTSPKAFYLVRLLLGIAEAGTFPGVWYYMSLFFPEHRLTVQLAFLEVAVVLSQVLSAPIGSALLSLHGFLGLEGWQWLFFLEGLPPIALGVFVYLTLPRSPKVAQFLTRKERDWLSREVRKSRLSKGLSGGKVTVWLQLKDSLTNGQLWIITLVKFLADLSAYTFVFYTPLLIETMLLRNSISIDPSSETCSASEGEAGGKSSAHIALLAAIPFAVSAVSSLLISWHSQMTGERRYHVAVLLWIAGPLFALLPVLARAGFVWGFVALIAGVAGTRGSGGVGVSLVVSITSPAGKAMSLAVFNSFGNIGGLLAPIIVGQTVDSTHSYAFAMVLFAAFLFLDGFFILAIKDPLEGKKQKMRKDDLLGEGEKVRMLPERELSAPAKARR